MHGGSSNAVSSRAEMLDNILFHHLPSSDVNWTEVRNVIKGGGPVA